MKDIPMDASTPIAHMIMIVVVETSMFEMVPLYIYRVIFDVYQRVIQCSRSTA